MAPTTTEDDSGRQDGTTSTDSSESGADREVSDLDEGLQEVHNGITNLLYKINDDGDRIQKVVARAFMGLDREVVNQLQRTINSQMAELHHEHEEVTIDEIAAALWIELNNVSEMATASPDQREEEAEDGSTSPDKDGTEDDEGLAALFEGGGTDSESEENGEEEAVADPAFQ